MNKLNFWRTAGAAMVFSMLAPMASGAVIGTLRITSDPGDVIVSLTSLDFTPPVGGGDGTFTVGAGTNLTYGDGTALTVGSTGTVRDLNAGDPFPIMNFLTFSAAPGLVFDLTGLGPGPANTVCSATLNQNSPACSVFAGSPFILQATSTGTAVTLSAIGTANDGSGLSSTFIGQFTTQITGRTPAQIQANILSGGIERSTYSGEFVATPIPEPGAATLFLLGGGLLAFARRRLAR